jgi:hypothetical protein
VKHLAERTCGSFSRAELQAGFAPGFSGGRLDANGIALKYVKEVDINPVPLQTAAYNGCLAGLER